MQLSTQKYVDMLSTSCQHCIICHQPSHRSLPLCFHCEAHLPWLTHACKQCAKPLHHQTTYTLCIDCRNHPSHCLAARSIFCFAYQTPINTMIKRWKFNHQWQYHHFLSSCFIKHLNSQITKDYFPDAIMAVPSSRKRLQERGFNQASVLSKTISKALNLNRLDNTIRCHQNHPHQAHLKAHARAHNLTRAFTLKTHKTLPSHIAIVDDVMTTGATLHSMAELLIAHGVKTIQYWGIARTSLNQGELDS